MKRFSFLLLCVIMVSSAKSQTVDEVINKYMEALGGLEKLKSLNSVTMTGSLNVGVDVDLVINVANKTGSRMDITVPGMDPGYQIYTLTNGWVYYPFQGHTSTQDASEEMVRDAQSSLDLQGILVDYKAKGNVPTLEGKEKVDGVECYKLKIKLANGKETTYFIDAQSFYRIKVSTISGGREVWTLYSSFKKNEDGFIFPFTQTSSQGTINFTSIRANQPIDANLFKP